MDTTINIRTKKSTRDQAKKIFSKLGISTSAGINMFLRQVVAEKGLPFTPKIDAKKLREQMDKEVAEALKNGKRYRTVEDLLRDLNK